jgi:hypothetical protein
MQRPCARHLRAGDEIGRTRPALEPRFGARLAQLVDLRNWNIRSRPPPCIASNRAVGEVCGLALRLALEVVTVRQKTIAMGGGGGGGGGGGVAAREVVESVRPGSSHGGLQRRMPQRQACPTSCGSNLKKASISAGDRISWWPMSCVPLIAAQAIHPALNKAIGRRSAVTDSPAPASSLAVWCNSETL